ncbi:MAG: hypothetical protein K2G52_02125 [Muribaculaceae bacterium]|nr:hypothetical protein [Muribaculaceae bacterium]
MNINITIDPYIPVSQRGIAFQRIASFVYSSMYACLYEDEHVLDSVQQELALLVKVSPFMERSFSEGRLWLIWALNYLLNNDILEDSPKIKDECLRLYSRPDVIWDPCPTYVPRNERHIDAEGVVLATWLSDEDNLGRYKIQEWAISHINYLHRLFESGNKFYPSCSISESFVHSALFFLQKMDQYNVYPFKVKPIIRMLSDNIEIMEDSVNRNIGIIVRDKISSANIDNTLSESEKLASAFFLFLYGILCDSSLDDVLPSPKLIEDQCLSIETFIWKAHSKISR